PRVSSLGARRTKHRKDNGVKIDCATAKIAVRLCRNADAGSTSAAALLGGGPWRRAGAGRLARAPRRSYVQEMILAPLRFAARHWLVLALVASAGLLAVAHGFETFG